MILIENPAARLLAILEKGKSIPPEQTCQSAWNTLLDVHATPNMFLPRLAKVMELPNQIIELLDLLDTKDKQKNANKHWIGQVNTGFMCQSLNSQWVTFIQHIDEHTINYLIIISDIIEKQSNIKAQDSTQELSDIKQTLQNLLNDILGNEELDKDKDIKRYLVRSLQRVIVAIDEHFISGYTPIIEAIETTIGYMALDFKTDEKKVYSAFYDTGVAKELVAALYIISAMVTLATGIPQLSNDFFQSLLHLKN
ncbi:MAG: hypothetical protein PHQ03_10220 [Methylococcales bacterium]|nr:hypothetical protein [Methylococcales bacterium]